MNIPVTAPTPENVAESLTSGDNDYHDGNDWWEGLSAHGNVLHITITPCDEDGEQCEKVRFEAHVFEVEPPAPVAAGPVELPVELARELAYCSVGHAIDGWTVVENEQFGTSRWESLHSLVIRNEAGEHYVDTYRRGLTEYQDTRPWECEKVACFEPVERRAKVVRSFEWVKPATSSGSPS